MIKNTHAFNKCSMNISCLFHHIKSERRPQKKKYRLKTKSFFFFLFLLLVLPYFLDCSFPFLLSLSVNYFSSSLNSPLSPFFTHSTTPFSQLNCQPKPHFFFHFFFFTSLANLSFILLRHCLQPPWSLDVKTGAAESNWEQLGPRWV